MQTISKDWQLYLLLIPVAASFFTWRYLPLKGSDNHNPETLIAGIN